MDYKKRYESLLVRNENLKKRYAELKKKYAAVTEENKSLNRALSEQSEVIDEVKAELYLSIEQAKSARDECYALTKDISEFASAIGYNKTTKRIVRLLKKRSDWRC